MDFLPWTTFARMSSGIVATATSSRCAAPNIFGLWRLPN
jgi:hypothetical protein